MTVRITIPIQPTCGQVKADDVIIRDAVKMLDEPTQRIAVSCDQHYLPCLQIRNDLILPQHLQNAAERLGEGSR